MREHVRPRLPSWGRCSVLDDTELAATVSRRGATRAGKTREASGLQRDPEQFGASRLVSKVMEGLAQLRSQMAGVKKRAGRGDNLEDPDENPVTGHRGAG